MSLALVMSRVAVCGGAAVLLFSLVAPRSARRPRSPRRFSMLALATLAVGLAMFALFFGLVAGCDRL